MRIIILLTFLCFKLSAQEIVKINREGGVYTIPCTVNGIPLRFIYDTGASDVTISLTEAQFMYKNGLIKSSDILWTQNYQTASGDIVEGLTVILREIKIGSLKIKNVMASIVLANDAPLLLGQSVISRIGKTQLDPQNSTLIITPFNSNAGVNKIKDGDGNIYSTVKIGNQTWMTENLRTTKFCNGEPISLIQQDADWVTAPASVYCIKDKNFYYDWYVVADQRGICPYGWHVPTEEEIMELVNFMRSNNLKTGSLKGTKEWVTPNAGAENKFGLNILPDGKRWHSDGKFDLQGYGAYLWTSTGGTEPGNALFYNFSFDTDVIKMTQYTMNDGFSIRCVND
jgi:clan AA aspartic protease (TIGR02281 family)